MLSRLCASSPTLCPCQHRWVFRSHSTSPPAPSSSCREWSKPRACLNSATSFFVVHSWPGRSRLWPTSNQGINFSGCLYLFLNRAVARILLGGRPSPFFLLLISVPLPPLFPIQLGGLGERCKLPLPENACRDNVFHSFICSAMQMTVLFVARQCRR